MHPGTILLALTLAVAVVGCDGPSEPAESPLTPAEFVEVVVEIREAEREVVGEDDAAELFHDRRREVLDRHGTTEAELRAFLAANARNLALLEEVWDTINARLTLTRPGGDAAEEGEEAVAPEAVEDDPTVPRQRGVPLPRDGERRPVIR